MHNLAIVAIENYPQNSQPYKDTKYQKLTGQKAELCLSKF